jgi:1-phosphofructokinase
LLTITVETGTNGTPDVHLHPGGQGVWIARMARALGAPVTLCSTFGGETGDVVRALLESEGFSLACSESADANGVYIHDRRSGERVEIASAAAPPLARHDLDAFYGAALVQAMRHKVCVLGGPHDDDLLPADTYRRWAGDLREHHVIVIADLSGDRLRAVLEGGVDVLKVSDEELRRDGWTRGDELDDLLPAVEQLRAAGASDVVVSRAEQPTIATAGDRLVSVEPPVFEPVDVRGGGDSLTAGIAAGLARGDDLAESLRLGAAAGSLNVTRRGLATGDRGQIEALLDSVTVRELFSERTPPTEIRTPASLAERVELP